MNATSRIVLTVPVLTYTLGAIALGEGIFKPRKPAESAALARDFLATLDEAGRKTVQFPFDVPERRRWRRDPAPRPGLALKVMTDRQRQIVHELLRRVLSAEGLATVEGIRKEQDLIAQNEDGLGSGWYWLAIYGEPGTGKWGWRLGGHHISLHVTYEGTQVISATPLLLGGEMEGDSAKDWVGYKALQARERQARHLLDGGLFRKSDVSWYEETAPEGLALSEPQSLVLDEPGKGIPLGRMNEGSRASAEELISEYVMVFEKSIAEKYRQAFGRIGDQIRFLWAGSREMGKLHYYRVHGPGLLIEYWNSGAHMHTLLRTDGDFGESPSTESEEDRIERFRRSGEFDKAFAAFREARTHARMKFELYGALHRLLTDPRLIANDDTRWGRDILRIDARSSPITLPPPDEPGEPIVVTGQVRDATGQPIDGALLYVFHADHGGRYTPTKAMDEPNARLFAFLRTGPDGRFEIRTIYPGPYPLREGVEGDARFIPRHVHFEITAGDAFRSGQMVFDDDPRMTPYWYQWAMKGDNPVAHVSRDGAGARRCSCDLVLKQEPKEP